MNWTFLSVEAALALHAAQIEEFGGAPGLRDYGLLESAVLRCENKAEYEPDSSIGVLAASVSFDLIKNHAFVDGNKRIGLSALINTLKLNQHRLICPKSKTLEMVLKAAASELTEAEWTVWVDQSVRQML